MSLTALDIIVVSLSVVLLIGMILFFIQLYIRVEADRVIRAVARMHYERLSEAEFAKIWPEVLLRSYARNFNA